MGVRSSVISSPLAAPQTHIMYGLACSYTSKYLLFFLESDLQELAKQGHISMFVRFLAVFPS